VEVVFTLVLPPNKKKFAFASALTSVVVYNSAPISNSLEISVRCEIEIFTSISVSVNW